MKIARVLFLLFISLVAGPVLAKSAVVGDVRVWAAPDHTRIVFEISGPVQHKLFSLPEPNRIVIDLSGATLDKSFSGSEYSKGIIKRIRSAPRNQDDLRVVLDISKSVKAKSFVLKPSQNYSHRLVIDLYEKDNKKKVADRVVKKKSRKMFKSRELVIAIDAGHGGDDPGAIGYRGTREKDVVFAIAKKLEALVNKEAGMRPVMIRKGDYYVGLRNRIKKARDNRADMFISIHADAFRDKRAKGASVYALSQKGASTEAARWLAQSENASDFVGGVSLEDKDDLLTSVLLDLSMSGTIEASMEMGKYVLDGLKKVGKVHKKRVEQAEFAVLKSPDTPSILIETAFISNPQEERNLLSSTHQRKVAGSIMNGVRMYFVRNPVPGTLLAGRKHTIARGDTLSGIASKYHVSLDLLKVANRLKNNHLKVGSILRIPSGSES